MKAWWRYQCDFGHEWEIYREVDAQEDPQHAVCPEGHRAVTRRIEPHADRTRIVILPATRLVDAVKAQLAFEDRYILLISRPDGTDERMSAKTYGWSDVVKIAERFRNKEFETSVAMWERTKP